MFLNTRRPHHSQSDDNALFRFLMTTTTIRLRYTGLTIVDFSANMSFCRSLQSPVTSSVTKLASRSPCLRQCPQPFRYFSSSRRAAQSTKRELQTASTFRPHTLPEGFPLPRNAGTPDTSISAAIPAQGAPQYSQPEKAPQQNESISLTEQEAQKSKPTTASSSPSKTTPSKPKRSKLRPRKAAMTLTPMAVSQLRQLVDQPDPRMIRVGVKNKGCSGLAYHLEYVDKPGKFDEVVEQEGVKVLIDSKALFSIIGSEMDWQEDKLSARFVFKNPNISKFQRMSYSILLDVY